MTFYRFFGLIVMVASVFYAINHSDAPYPGSHASSTAPYIILAPPDMGGFGVAFTFAAYAFNCHTNIPDIVQGLNEPGKKHVKAFVCAGIMIGALFSMGIGAVCSLVTEHSHTNCMLHPLNHQTTPPTIGSTLAQRATPS